MNDEQLRQTLARLKSGEKEALAEIYDGLITPLYTIALRVTGNRQLAEEAVQELFLKLTATPPRELSHPRAYLFAAARNAAIDILRREPSHENVDDHHDLAAPEREDTSDVAEALALLPEEQRSVVTLRINGGLKFREIAQATHTPLGTVLWRYNRAISSLKSILNGGKA